jgi:hypothetical protein
MLAPEKRAFGFAWDPFKNGKTATASCVSRCQERIAKTAGVTSEFQSKRVLVTGASRGIGEATVLASVARGLTLFGIAGE